MLHIMKKMFTLFLGLIYFIFRCKRRKSQMKSEENFVPTEVVVEKSSSMNSSNEMCSNMNHLNNVRNNTSVENDSSGTVDDWNSWGIMDNHPAVINTSEVAYFFQDMEPSVKVKKVYVKTKRSSKQGLGNMLAVRPEDEIKLSAELAVWEDEETEATGWEEEDVNINCDQIAAEAKLLRMQERKQKSEEMKRHKETRKQQGGAPHKLGMKVS